MKVITITVFIVFAISAIYFIVNGDPSLSIGCSAMAYGAVAHLRIKDNT